MMKRISLWGLIIVAIVLAAQLFWRGRPQPSEDVSQPPREQLLAVDPPAEPPPNAEPVDGPAALEDVASTQPSLPSALETFAAEGPDGSRRFLFDCGAGGVFAARVLGEEATVFSPSVLGTDVLTLTQTEAASGVRYAAGDAVFWNKGSVATFEVRGRTSSDCVSEPGLVAEGEARRRGATFRALGNEPSWVLEITPQLFELRTELGTRRSDFPYRAPTVAGARTTYRSFASTGELVVVIDRVPCNDTMSGELFAYTVVVTFEGATMYGCGRNPGMPW